MRSHPYAGEPVTFVLEVGPITHYGTAQRDPRLMEARTRLDLEGLIRGYFAVGKRNKLVRSRVEREAA